MNQLSVLEKLKLNQQNHKRFLREYKKYTDYLKETPAESLSILYDIKTNLDLDLISKDYPNCSVKLLNSGYLRLCFINPCSQYLSIYCEDTKENIMIKIKVYHEWLNANKDLITKAKTL